MAHRCTYRKDDGTRCRANAMRGSDYCFTHDPAKADERRAARQAGGRVGKAQVLPSGTPDVPLGSVADLLALLGETINQVRRGDLDPKVANTVGYLSGTLLRALEVGDLETRLAKLEAAVAAGGPEAGTAFDTEPLTPETPFPEGRAA